MSDRTTIGVGMVGYAFMGRVHSQAWRSVGAFFDLPLTPRMAVLAGRSKEPTEAAAAQLGWAAVETDWRVLVERDDVQIVVARRYVEQGRIGEIRHVRAQYLQDWIVDPEFPLVWRLQKDKAGSGALGDIGAHIVDAAQFITGQNVAGVSALTETFIRERPLATGSAGLGATGSTERGAVTVDDAALFIGRMSGGAVASFEATRFANGRKNAMRIEINGSLGSLAFDFEAMNELWFSAGGGGFERILVTEPDHPYVGAWWPPGHGLGYEHTFTHEIKDFLEAVATGADPTPSFADGLRVQRVLEAVERSAADGSRYTNVED
ncbi:Gfo/Idh/MocA family oxidoreductase [Nonomuraea sp. MG754425]|uniref:Gfo/Idh/MocA family protein n=1 Tax=Nonomuraea sp. MG754425 TaxID=2570319 RepID=UPI001F3A69DA|nr:Gfo/Idh/MocA family oxidoreductase [Nonomuraea sp. MG754425]MCF6472299.1 Gfo/Idh/MocA family oxidoreductase [Nonomuraea sp. MG754425]